jgi:hypothetical protein
MPGNVDFVFKSGNGGGLAQSDPRETPVTIVGQLDHLKKVKFEDVKCKLAPRVTDEQVRTD